MKRLLLPLIALSLAGGFPVRAEPPDRPARNEATEERKGKPKQEKKERRDGQPSREERTARPEAQRERPEQHQERQERDERRAPEKLRERAEPMEQPRERAAPKRVEPEAGRKREQTRQEDRERSEERQSPATTRERAAPEARPQEPSRSSPNEAGDRQRAAPTARERDKAQPAQRQQEDRADDREKAAERRQQAIRSAQREDQARRERAQQLHQENQARLNLARTARNTAEVRHLESRVSTLERMQAESDQRRDAYRRAISERPRWSRGDRIPREYWRSYRPVDNWRIYGLRTPPRGYHWVRSSYNDFILVQIGGWVIAESWYRWDRDYYWRHRYDRIYSYDDDYFYRECRYSADPAGILAGAMIGGLIGGAVSDGDAGGTIAGVILGGAAGAAMTRNLNCDDNSYAYRTYYVALNADRTNADYEWRNPRTGTHGVFYVGNYYPDPDGFMCARYRQEIYVGGRRYSADGNACRQPDGAWMFLS